MSRLHLQHNQTAIIKGINPCKVLPSVSGPWQAFNKGWLLSGWGEDNSKQSKTVPGAEHVVQGGLGERGWSRVGSRWHTPRLPPGPGDARAPDSRRKDCRVLCPESPKTHLCSEMSVVLVLGTRSGFLVSE